MRVLSIFLTVLTALLWGCTTDSLQSDLTSRDDAVDFRGEPLRAQVDIRNFVGLTTDENGNIIVPGADPATPIYYVRTGLPVLGPDGHHITAGEYAAARGTAEVKCLNPGTQVKLKMSDLIPNATYRAWILTFKEPGFDLAWPDPFINLIGEGALGPNDRSRNTFTSSASGQGAIVLTMPEGALSEFGSVGNCLLSEVFEWHVFLAFQQPGQPDGPEVGPPNFFPESAVEQFGFVFRQ